MSTNKAKVKSNLIYGFGGQILIMIMGIVLPRFIIVSFGSDVNGLVSAVSQIFTYLALLEAGIGNASLNLLYKNIANKNNDDIQTTLSATQTFFHKLTPLYVIGVIAFMIVYPFVAKTNVDSGTICAIIAIHGASGIISFYCTNTWTQLLIADGRNYVVSNISLLQRVLSTTVQIALIMLGCNIIAVQILQLVLTILKAVIINIYVKKTYPWFRYSLKGDTSILEQRGAFAIHEISNVIFQSTDVFILSTFCSTAIASVYAIYNLVYVSLNSFLSLFNKGFDFILGQTYNGDKERYVVIHDAYEAVYMALVYATMTVACVLTLPFVKLYTAGIEDVNYIYNLLPVMFALIQILSCSRAVSSKLITISNHARSTVVNTIIESVLNIVCSLVLVQFIGIYGVLLGTIIALLYRTNDIIIYANIKILKRKPFNTYKNVIIFLAMFFGFTYLFSVLNVACNSYVQLILNAVWIALVIYASYAIVTVLLNKNVTALVKAILKK